MNSSMLLVTCGNAQAGDDGFGPSVAGSLSRAPIAGVHVADLGTRPDRLLDHLGGAGYEALVIVDAALCPDLPLGRVIECDWRSPSRPVLADDRELSSHGLSLAGQIELAEKLAALPPIVRLIAVNICGARAGERMTPVVAAQIEPVRARIAQFANELLNQNPSHGESPCRELSRSSR